MQTELHNSRVAKFKKSWKTFQVETKERRFQFTHKQKSKGGEYLKKNYISFSLWPP